MYPLLGRHVWQEGVHKMADDVSIEDKGTTEIYA
jgi:hypothetical protein